MLYRAGGFYFWTVCAFEMRGVVPHTVGFIKSIVLFENVSIILDVCMSVCLSHGAVKLSRLDWTGLSKLHVPELKMNYSNILGPSIMHVPHLSKLGQCRK
jgi:hypothetical protein